MFDWEGFKNGEFSVNLKSMNNSDKIEFLNECEKRGYIGTTSKRKPTEMMDYTTIRVDNKNKKTLEQHSCVTSVIYNSHAIDCSLAENYTVELNRMCNQYSACYDCAMNGLGVLCREAQANNPQKAIEIVQAWSDEHPKEKVVTYLDKLLKIFPKTPLNENGIPETFCPAEIGLEDLESCRITLNGRCEECWSQPYKENANGQD